jgi:hypothetical protein
MTAFCVSFFLRCNIACRQQAGAAAQLGLAIDFDEDVSNTMEYIDNALLNENTQPDHSQSAPDSYQPTRVPSVPKVQPSSAQPAAPASSAVGYAKPRNVPISPAISSHQPRIATPVPSEAASLFRSPSPAQLQNPQQSPVVLELGINTEDLNLTPRGQSPSEEGFASKGILKRQFAFFHFLFSPVLTVLLGTGSASSPDSVSLQASRDRKRVRWSPDAKALFINMGTSSEVAAASGKGLFSGDDFNRPDLCNCNAAVESLGIPFGPPIKCVLASQGIDTIGKLSTISAAQAKNIFRELLGCFLCRPSSCFLRGRFIAASHSSDKSLQARVITNHSHVFYFQVWLPRRHLILSLICFVQGRER